MSEVCTRCGCTPDRLYTIPLKNEDDAIIIHRLCWECDWDISNGGDVNEDMWEVISDRKENNYAYDPINNPKPEGYQ